MTAKLRNDNTSSVKGIVYQYYLTRQLLEMRKVAKLITDATAIDSIVSLAIDENVIQLDKEKRCLKLSQIFFMPVYANRRTDGSLLEKI